MASIRGGCVVIILNQARRMRGGEIRGRLTCPHHGMYCIEQRLSITVNPTRMPCKRYQPSAPEEHACETVTVILAGALGRHFAKMSKEFQFFSLSFVR
jgi:hypothetical protein